MLKRKRSVERREEQEHELLLTVSILGIDGTTVNPTSDKRTYRVFGYVIPGEEFCTPEAEGLPNPTWTRKYELPLGKYMPDRYLNLEVVRTESKSDPGTSTGVALVGRTRIPLPMEGETQKSGRFELVRPEKSGSIAEGHIVVSMRIHDRIQNMDQHYY